MENEAKKSIGSIQLDNEVKPAIKADGVRKADRQTEPGSTHRARKGKKQLSTTRHGMLSRHPREALMKAGANPRELQRIERSLREEFPPKGIIGHIWFDRALSCYWRCSLIALKEKHVFAAENQPVNFKERVEQAEQAFVLAATSGNSKSGDIQPSDFLKNLSIMQRYDAHFFREFCRALSFLLASQGAGDAGLTLLLGKTFGQHKDVSEETND
jgi:hypothetical protein